MFEFCELRCFLAAVLAVLAHAQVKGFGNVVIPPGKGYGAGAGYNNYDPYLPFLPLGPPKNCKHIIPFPEYHQQPVPRPRGEGFWYRLQLPSQVPGPWVPQKVPSQGWGSFAYPPPKGYVLWPPVHSPYHNAMVPDGKAPLALPGWPPSYTTKKPPQKPSWPPNQGSVWTHKPPSYPTTKPTQLPPWIPTQDPFGTYRPPAYPTLKPTYLPPWVTTRTTRKPTQMPPWMPSQGSVGTKKPPGHPTRPPFWPSVDGYTLGMIWPTQPAPSQGPTWMPGQPPVWPPRPPSGQRPVGGGVKG